MLNSDPIHDRKHVFMRIYFKENRSFWKNQSHMRPQTKLICGKWSYIDPLITSFSSKKKWLWLCFYNVNSTVSWKHTFSFGAIWGVFRQDFVHIPMRTLSIFLYILPLSGPVVCWSCMHLCWGLHLCVSSQTAPQSALDAIAYHVEIAELGSCQKCIVHLSSRTVSVIHGKAIEW